MSIQSVAATATLVAIASSGIGFLWKHQDGISVFLHRIAGMERTEFCDRTPQVRKKIMGVLNVDLDHCEGVTLMGLQKVERLYLSDSSITGLQPGDFAGLAKLTTLELSNNGLTALPKDVFANLKSLKTLNLEDNQLSALPPGVFDDLIKLERLDLGKNNLDLEGLPEGVFNDLGDLKELRLGGNHLDGLTLEHTLLEHLNSDVIDLGRLDDSGSTKQARGGLGHPA